MVEKAAWRSAGTPRFLIYQQIKGPLQWVGLEKTRTSISPFPRPWCLALRQPDPETDRPDLEQSHW